MDDSAIGFGASLLGKEALSALTEEDSKMEEEDDSLTEWVQLEQEMRAVDEAEARKGELRNRLESFVFELRQAMSNPKYGHLLDSEAISPLLNEAEDWMWTDEATGYNPETGETVKSTALIPVWEAKIEEYEQALKSQCETYFQTMEADHIATERSLEEEAKKAQDEAEANGEDDDDERRLPPNTRLRLVKKNKDEGTELLKGGNFKPAAARYCKALSHCGKFFDIGPDMQEEVKALQLSLNLNVALCYLKMEKWQQVVNYASHALDIDADNVKGLFRRATAYEKLNDIDRAMEDIARIKQINGDENEDKAVTKLEKKVRGKIQRQEEREKRMWSRAFA
jgi:tetratricopeptide (TPR) repeat protein